MTVAPFRVSLAVTEPDNTSTHYTEYDLNGNPLEIVTLDGEQYLKFATQEFSPFVLVWDEVSNSSGGGGGGGGSGW